MKTHRALVAGIVLAGMLLVLQAPLIIVAQDAPSQNQVQQDQVQQNQVQDQAPPAQDQAQQEPDQAPPAQDQGQPAEAAQQSPAQDPPGRVARLSYLAGSVS